MPKVEAPPTPLSTMTKEEKIFQKQTLAKYRGITGFVPSLQEIALWSGTSISTAASFVSGNSSNGKVRALLKTRAIKNLVPLPDDMKKLIAIWDRDSQPS